MSSESRGFRVIGNWLSYSQRGITRLKIRWSDHAPSPREDIEPPASARRPQQDPPTTIPVNQASISTQSRMIRPMNSPSTVVPTPPPTSQAATSPAASLTHARVEDSSFNNVGNDMNNTVVHDRSRRHGFRNTYGNRYQTVVYGDHYVFNFHGEGRGE